MISFHDIAKGSRHVIRFLHVATGNTVEFPAFITDFSDSYSVSWGTEQIYGRMDPIKPYQGTTRSISLAFDVVSPDLETARENMFNYSKLSQMMYPVYSSPLFGSTPGPGQKGRVLKAPPILRLEFMNLVTNLSQDATDRGLLGCISGVSFNPSQEAGFFTANNEILSKAFNLSITFDPQHESELGYAENSDQFLTQEFPYGRPEVRTVTGRDSNNNTTDRVAQARTNKALKGST